MILVIESGGRINKKGFTSVEVIMVVVILGIIIGGAVPSYIAISNNIKEKNYNINLMFLVQWLIIVLVYVVNIVLKLMKNKKL